MTYTPLGAVARGLTAGVAGTAAMTGWQSLAARLRSADQADGDAGQGGAPDDPWARASVPARLGRRVIEGVFEREVTPDKIGLLTNVMHWGYGTAWGAVYGLLEGSRPGRSIRRGLVFGAGVWAMSYAQLVPIGLYEPPWKYPPSELALDLSYHVAYGLGVGVGWSLLDRLVGGGL